MSQSQFFCSIFYAHVLPSRLICISFLSLAQLAYNKSFHIIFIFTATNHFLNSGKEVQVRLSVDAIKLAKVIFNLDNVEADATKYSAHHNIS